MPRGKRKKPLSLQEQYENITQEIEDLTATLKEKKQELKEIEAAIEDENRQRIIDAMEEKGLSVEDVLGMIESVDEE